MQMRLSRQFCNISHHVLCGSLLLRCLADQHITHGKNSYHQSVCWPCSSNSNWLLPPGPMCLGPFLGYIWATLGVQCEWWGGEISVTCWHGAYFPLFAECREKKSSAFQSGQIPGPWGCIFHPLWRESECPPSICFFWLWNPPRILAYKMIAVMFRRNQEHLLV